MPILPQSAPFSIPLLSCPFPLLAAPPPLLLLPPPRVAGLLPARVPVPAAKPRIEIVREVPATLEELFAQIGPIRSQEEMDAEIVEMLLLAEQRIERRYGQPSGLIAFWESLP